MKVPAPPPSLEELMAKLQASDRLLHVLTRAVPGTMTQDYFPWDKLRYTTPPEDLTSEEWWLAIRYARKRVQRDIPQLRDVQGVPFNYSLPDGVLEGVDYVNRNASGNITISEQVTNPSTRDRYILNSLIEEAITSSQLEGAVTSRRVAKEMIRSGRPPEDRSERMILNNYIAMRRITELKDDDLTPEIICEIHRIVTDGTLDRPEAAGKIQDDDALRISVWGDGNQLLHKPPPVSELPERLRNLCDFANGVSDVGYIPPVLRAITLHFMMGYDHYFEDGNGRTARALFYWSLLRQGYWLTEFLTISRILKKAPAKYGRSFLLTEQDEGDLTHFFIYHLGILKRAIDELHGYLARKAEELREIQSSIKAMPNTFNYRQLTLLEHAVRTPGAAYSAQSHATSHNISHETARQDLIGLERRGLLTRAKIRKRFVWAPVSDLPERLKSP
jgi:Fic family protein